ncbi:MAG: thiol-disulfide oxidoreductase DCC family protein [Flavobacteriales bacterium]
MNCKPTVLVDRSCGICSTSERFVKRYTVKHNISFDDRERIRFHIDDDSVIDQLQQCDSVILIDHKGIHTEFKAVQRILFHCGGILRLLSYFTCLIPKGIGDSAYRMIARRRHTISSCIIKRKSPA